MTANGKPPTRRVNRGTGHSYYLDGPKVPGVTTVLRSYPKDLTYWAGGAVADKAIDHWDELGQLPLSKRRTTLVDAIKEAQNAAKRRGTNFHALARRHLLGEEVDVPEADAALFDQYEAFLDDWQVADLLVEQPFWSRSHGYAGTPDLVAILADGKTWLLDWKTGVKGRVYLEHVLQLAALRFAEFTLVDGKEVPVASLGIERCGVVVLKADEYQLVPVEANEDAFFVFRCVKWLHGYREQGDDAWIGNPIDLATVTE